MGCNWQINPIGLCQLLCAFIKFFILLDLIAFAYPVQQQKARQAWRVCLVFDAGYAASRAYAMAGIF